MAEESAQSVENVNNTKVITVIDDASATVATVTGAAGAAEIPNTFESIRESFVAIYGILFTPYSTFICYAHQWKTNDRWCSYPIRAKTSNSAAIDSANAFGCKSNNRRSADRFACHCSNVCGCNVPFPVPQIVSISKRRQQDISEAEQDLQWMVADIAVRKSVCCFIHHKVPLCMRRLLAEEGRHDQYYRLCSTIFRSHRPVHSDRRRIPCQWQGYPRARMCSKNVRTKQYVSLGCSLARTPLRFCFRRWEWHTSSMPQYNANVIFPMPRSSSIYTSRSMTVLARILERYV